tara:strand:+ start:1268 stop:1582 length:315 start_codon:yes stop_codon:yes gene_type:complete
MANINLKDWYTNNPSKKLNGKRWNYKDNLDSLHSLQVAHHNGELNLYESVESYEENWVHLENRETRTMIKAHPKAGTRRRNDLPPVYIQWKDEYRKRSLANIQH